MGTKTVKWELGQKMLVKAVMDQQLYDLIDNNIYVAGFTDTDMITDRNGVTVSVSYSRNTAPSVYMCVGIASDANAFITAHSVCESLHIC